MAQLQKLRKQLRTVGGSFNVAKARLMKLAARDVEGYAPLEPYFKDQIGIVFATQELAPVAKVLAEFSKDHASLKIVAGFGEQMFLDAARIEFVASLPSRDTVLAQLCGVLKAPIAQLARVLAAVKDKQEQAQS